MDSSGVVFDISSDDEQLSEFGEPRGDDDPNWLTALLETVNKETEDFDEVVVVGEYNPPKPKSKSKSVKPVDDDDDCVVLNGDPDKPAAVLDVADGDAGDDVVIVGQKGQIACRDYPHPRHLCAEFPFISTPHERHCDLCHCYVCDSLAPCAHWGTGVSSIDHCHATDKLDTWKTQRENFRLGKTALLSVSQVLNTPLPVAVPQLKQTAPSIRLAPNSISQNQISRPAAMRACPSPMLRIPNIISHSRNRQLGFIRGRSGFVPCSVSQQPLGVHNNVRRQERVPNTVNLGQQCVSSNTMFKRPGIARRASAMNQSGHGSLNSVNTPASQLKGNAASLDTSKDINSTRQQDVLTNTLGSYTYPSSSQPNLGGAILNSVASVHDVYSQPLQSSDGQNIYQLGNQSQNVTNSEISDFDFGWLNNFSQSNCQSSVENIQLHSTVSNTEPSTVNQFSSQFTGSAQLQYKDPQYDSWLLGQSVPVASEGCVPTDLNVFSLEPPAIDAGMLYFDFETSWNGLTHV